VARLAAALQEKKEADAPAVTDADATEASTDAAEPAAE
jgi:hypothetical protein